MRQMTVMGFLGADAKVETSKQGTRYLSMRMASQEYGEEKAVWISVRSYNEGIVNKLAPYLKKGSHIIATGDYSDSMFTRENNENIILRDLKAYSIQFVNSGKKTENAQQPIQGQSGVAATQSQKPQQYQKQSATKLTQQPPVQQVQTQGSNSYDGDLPF